MRLQAFPAACSSVPARNLPFRERRLGGTGTMDRVASHAGVELPPPKGSQARDLPMCEAGCRFVDVNPRFLHLRYI